MPTAAGINIVFGSMGFGFIQTGLLEREYGRIYQQLYDNRQAGDYEDVIYYDQITYDELMPQAERFIQRVRICCNCCGCRNG